VVEGVDVPMKYFVKDPLYGWTGHTSGKITTIDSPGGHVSMLLDEPWVNTLAESIIPELQAKTTLNR
jgi:hypothetical protein